MFEKPLVNMTEYKNADCISHSLCVKLTIAVGAPAKSPNANGVIL